MILEFLWIKNFRVLQEIGFNFSSKYIFDYDKDNKTLKRKLNKNYIDSFFGHHVTEVTALIGENGVGKSTLFEFILRNLANFGDGGALEYNDSDFVAVYSNIIFVTNVELLSNVKELEESGYRIEEYINTASLFVRLFETDYKLHKYVYYSNVFDYKREYETSFFVDVSTNHLLIEDSVNSEQQIKLFMFVNAELKRQIDFISSTKYLPPFKLPNELIINISKNVYKYKMLIDNAVLEKEGLNNVNALLKREFPHQPHEYVTWLLFLNLIKYRSIIKKELYLDILPEKLLNLYKNNLKEIDEYTHETQIELRKIKKVIDNYWSLLGTQRISFHTLETGDILQYVISEDNTEFFGFINSINDLMSTDTFLYYSWLGLSSGEKAYLSLLGRMKEAEMKLESEEFKRDFITILIDECDLYMHPAWQRDLFNVLHIMLPRIFEGKKLQLIMSSHSPFIVSDLPNSNIIFLMKDLKDKDNPSSIFQCRIEENFNKTTFGSNIHNLFIDSFFMSKGLIGEFAKSKIFELLKELENTKLPSEEEIRDLKKKINIIGEPMIRQKLFEVLYIKIANDDLRKRHEFLENELTELNREIEKRNHEEG
jgi:predicted ATP-dependent endonuclease of OLD family